MMIMAPFHHNRLAYPQSENVAVVKNDTWISKQNNLNITMSLEPKVPVIDEKTKLSFEISKLNGTGLFENLSAKATITDQDGRLFKFNNEQIPVSGGKFSVEYRFPSEGEQRVILQLYKNGTAFAIGSFDIVIPKSSSPTPPSPTDLFSGLFKSPF
jgi:hypothetical protein